MFTLDCSFYLEFPDYEWKNSSFYSFDLTSGLITGETEDWHYFWNLEQECWLFNSCIIIHVLLNDGSLIILSRVHIFITIKIYYDISLWGCLVNRRLLIIYLPIAYGADPSHKIQDVISVPKIPSESALMSLSATKLNNIWAGLSKWQHFDT